MGQCQLTKVVDAALEIVFETVSDPRHLSKAMERVEQVKFVDDTRAGLGTRFELTFKLAGEPNQSEVTISEFKEHEFVKFTTQFAGASWSTEFKTQKTRSEKTKLTMTVTSEQFQLYSMLTAPLTWPRQQKDFEADLEQIKTYCEC